MLAQTRLQESMHQKPACDETEAAKTLLVTDGATDAHSCAKFVSGKRHGEAQAIPVALADEAVDCRNVAVDHCFAQIHI